MVLASPSINNPSSLDPFKVLIPNVSLLACSRKGCAMEKALQVTEQEAMLKNGGRVA